MQKKSSLLGGVALGAVLAATLGSTAEAKTHHHHAASAGGNSALAAKVDSLTAAVSDLEARLNDEAQARQQMAADAAAAKADAAEARAQAAAAQGQLQAQIQTIPGQVNTAVAANKPKPSWADNTTVSGTAFFNVSNISQSPHPTTNGNNVLNKNENGFNYDLKRFYIAIDHKFNDVFSANITTDFTYDNATASVAAQTVTIPNGSLGCTTVGGCIFPVSAGGTLVTGDRVTQLYIKKAYLQAKLSDALIFRVGSADLPWVPFVEGLYGYRYVENVMIDRTKFGTSADWGIHVLGALPVSPKVTINYALSAVNGMGYKIPGIGTANRSSSMDFEGRVSATVDKKLTVAVGGYVGKLGNAVQGAVTPNTAQRFDALAVYVDPRFRIGGEYFWAHAWNDVTKSTAAANNSQGVSVFGSVNITPKVAVFGRYDWVQPQETHASTFKDNYFNFGVSYEPTKIVDFALVYKRDSIANGILSTSNGSIGVGSGFTGTYDEVGVWSQVKW